MTNDQQSADYVIYTDGACRGNPGPGGWGVFVAKDNKGDLKKSEVYGGEPLTTNNKMELTAAIEALKLLASNVGAVVYTDSQYVKNGIESWMSGWKKNGWRTAAKKPVKNIELWQALDKECARMNVEWRWVKGHAGDPGNERADALANLGIDTLETTS